MIAIPNMEKPKECQVCPIFIWCYTTDWKGYEHCPLIEVVHCKDCKHLGIDNGMPFCWMWVREVENESEIFCSYGERRADETQP